MHVLYGVYCSGGVGVGVTRLLSCGRYRLKSFYFGTAAPYPFWSALINCMYCITRRGRGWGGGGGWRGWPDSVTLWTLWTQSLHFVTAVSFLGKENQKTTEQANKSPLSRSTTSKSTPLQWPAKVQPNQLQVFEGSVDNTFCKEKKKSIKILK